MADQEDRNNQNHTDAFWARVDAVINLILENDRYMNKGRTPELTDMIIKKFGIDIRMGQIYIKEAKKEIAKMGERDKEKAFIKSMRDREFLFNKAKGGFKDDKGNFVVYPDYKLALDVIKDRDKIHGLYEENVNINGNISNTVDLKGLSTENILALISELKKLNDTETESTSPTS